MLFGNSNEIAVSFEAKERAAGSHFVFGNFRLIVGNKTFFSKHQMVTLDSVLNRLKNPIEPYSQKSNTSKDDLYFIGCLLSGYLHNNEIPDIPLKIWNSDDDELNKFTDDYFDFLQRIRSVFDVEFEIPLTPELVDGGGRFFLFNMDGCEIVVCTEDGGLNIDLFKLAPGSYERFIKSLPANVPNPKK